VFKGCGDHRDLARVDRRQRQRCIRDRSLRRASLGFNADRLAETARRAGIATWVAVITAATALVVSALSNDFSVAYILHHSNRDLPVPYKMAALWSGQEGSLLFWALLLSSYGLVLRLRHKVDVKLVAYASCILAGIQLFFLLLLNFAANPFGLVAGAVPADGNGLNPLLQYPEMVIHPQMLYLGYVGFSVPAVPDQLCVLLQQAQRRLRLQSKYVRRS